MHEIHVSVLSAEAAENGVAELWSAGSLIGYTILNDSDLMLRIEPRHDQAAVTVGARSLATALRRAEQMLETYPRAAAGGCDWPALTQSEAATTLRQTALESR